MRSENLHNENWDDLRYVLAVAETGSVLQAAKRLGVNHATVLRHVAAFEERHGVPIFERTAQGYRLLPDRVHVLQAAQDAQLAMLEVGRLASGGSLSYSGTVRITSTDTICALVLPGFVSNLTAIEHDLQITLLSSNVHLDLIREQAQLVVRPAKNLAEDLIGSAVCELGFAAYAQRSEATHWHALAGPLARSIAAKWISDNVSADRMASASDSFITLRELAAKGEGIAVLPRFVGDCDPRLIRLEDVMPPLSVPVWVARHADTIESQQLRQVRTKLEAYLTSQSDVLTGST